MERKLQSQTKTLSFQNTVSERIESCIKSLKIKNKGTI